MTPILRLINRTGLVTQICIGLVAGIALALLAPAVARDLGFLGKVFVSALKAVAPILVFILVMASIANHRHGQETHIRPILWLYLLGTFAAAVVAVVASMLFPSNLVLSTGEATLSAPGGITEVLQNLLLSAVDNPINALLNANFIGVLTWAIGLGVALRHAGDTTRTVVEDLSNGVTLIVRVVIRFAPLGIFGLVSATLAQSGLDALLGYLHLLAVLIGCMLFVALVMNPLIVFWKIRRNPYPLTLLCLRERAASPRSSPAARQPTSRSTWHCRRNSACTRTPIRCRSRWARPSTWPVRQPPSPCSPWPPCTLWASRSTCRPRCCSVWWPRSAPAAPRAWPVARCC
ncbi:Na+/serine symporter [Pseudomonas hunanensis]|nr:Na+/serine symporter [Pseudomonas hunanensis]